MTLPAVPPFFWPPGVGEEPPHKPEGAIGHDGQCHLLARHGGVIAVDPTGQRPDRWVNTNAETFADSLRSFASEWARRNETSESEEREQVVRLRGELQAIDAEALSNPENWWAVVLEQMTDGLL